MSLKIEFVERAEKGEQISALCREFGISRTAGHKWVKRFRERGYEGLEDASKRPKSAPLATAEELVLAVLESRESHPRWGPRKLEVLLRRRFGEQTPSERTIARILRRAGKVRERRRRRPLSIVENAPTVQARQPNEVWTSDFKGWWRAQNGERCDPLTIRDAASRYVLACTLTESTTAAVQQVFLRLFRKYGVPGAIQVDNGVPFVCVRARGGLSTLSAWWVSLGIKLVRSRPSCPQDNGAHERMHADVSGEVQTSPSPTRELQQRALDRWRQEFNQVRPHQALGNMTPAEVYKPKAKKPVRPVAYRYPLGFAVYRVNKSGHILLGKEVYHVSMSLGGHLIGVQNVDELHARLWFHDVDLGLIEVAPSQLDAMIGGWMKGRRARADSAGLSGSRSTNTLTEVVSVPVSTHKQSVSDLLS
jgi:transposase InsO family protein